MTVSGGGGDEQRISDGAVRSGSWQMADAGMTGSAEPLTGEADQSMASNYQTMN